MTDSESKKAKQLKQIEQETGVVYQIEDSTVMYTGDKNDTQHFINIVTYLLEKGHVTNEDIPYTPGYGKIRYLLNHAPVHQDGREMTRAKEVIEGVYLETNHDTESKKRYTKQLIQDFVID